MIRAASAGCVQCSGASRKAREGVAAVEFALILPFMLLLYVGSIELSDLINVDRRVTVIAGTVGDLVARNDGGITPGRRSTDYFNAAEGIITPYQTTGLKQVVTCVEDQLDGTTATVQWSKAAAAARREDERRDHRRLPHGDPRHRQGQVRDRLGDAATPTSR